MPYSLVMKPSVLFFSFYFEPSTLPETIVDRKDLDERYRFFSLIGKQDVSMPHTQTIGKMQIVP